MKPLKKKREYNEWAVQSRFPGGRKYIAWNAESRTYVNYSCLGETTDRNYAWVGTAEQFKNMQKEYPWTIDFKRYLDGDEKQI